MSYILLLDDRVDVPGRQDSVRIRTHAQVIDVIGDIDPAMRHGCRDDDDVAGLYHPLDDVVSGDDSAAGRTVEHLRYIAVGRGLTSVDDVAAGDDGPTTGDDD